MILFRYYSLGESSISTNYSKISVEMCALLVEKDYNCVDATVGQPTPAQGVASSDSRAT